MAKVEIGNFYYFMYIAIGVVLTLIAVRFLNKKSSRFQYWFIFF